MSRPSRCFPALPALLFLAGALAWASEPTATAGSSAKEAPAILFSRQLLEATGHAVGDIVSLSTDPGGGTAVAHRIAGVYEPLADPLQLGRPRLEAHMHLPDLLELAGAAGAETVSAINLALEDPDQSADIAAQLMARVPGVIARPTRGTDDGSNPFIVLERFHLAIALVTVVGSTAFLFALMVMRADERREMVGILRLLGLSRSRVLLTVFVEGLVVAVVGALFGVLIAKASQGGFNRFFQWRYDTSLVFVRVTASIAWRCVALAIPLGVVAGIVASWTLLRREVLALLQR